MTPQAGQAETKLKATDTQSPERKVRFELDVPKARSVSVVGTFNNWTPGATRLVLIGGTKWLREIFLPRGRLEYRFVVDGKWVDPPNAKAYVPNPHGGQNAVAEI
ncbi:MAG: isoamylase early set domain-containing protein [Verrucomicrobia bacterium]|nr:isoamylase early set domain-containing protein [Verrucomicrobiota bacterium]